MGRLNRRSWLKLVGCGSVATASGVVVASAADRIPQMDVGGRRERIVIPDGVTVFCEGER